MIRTSGLMQPLANWSLWLLTSMRRPVSVKNFLFAVPLAIADCRPTGGIDNLPPFLLRKVFCSTIKTADRRPSGRLNAAFSNFQITDSPYFHPHSFMERLLRCQLGVLNLEWVLPSRTRTDALFSGHRPSPTPQSPKLGDLV